MFWINGLKLNPVCKGIENTQKYQPLLLIIGIFNNQSKSCSIPAEVKMH